MRKTYGELNLRKLCNEIGIDFAHYTYGKGMCSCCYRPTDMPAKYWRGRTKKERQELKESCMDRPVEGHPGYMVRGDDYTYIWFKNAYNGSGTVKKTDYICRKNGFSSHKEFVGWKFPMEKMEAVCRELANQLGPDYKVIAPEDNLTTIIIEYIGKD